MLIEVLFAVIVRELVTRFDVLHRIDPDATLHNLWFAVWLAGVVDVPRKVVALCAIDRLTTIDFKKVQASAFVLFLLRDFATEIFDNARTLFDRRCSKQSVPMTPSFYLESKRTCRLCSFCSLLRGHLICMKLYCSA